MWLWENLASPERRFLRCKWPMRELRCRPPFLNIGISKSIEQFKKCQCLLNQRWMLGGRLFNQRIWDLRGGDRQGQEGGRRRGGRPPSWQSIALKSILPASQSILPALKSILQSFESILPSWQSIPLKSILHQHRNQYYNHWNQYYHLGNQLHWNQYYQHRNQHMVIRNWNPPRRMQRGTEDQKGRWRRVWQRRSKIITMMRKLMITKMLMTASRILMMMALQ